MQYDITQQMTIRNILLSVPDIVHSLQLAVVGVSTSELCFCKNNAFYFGFKVFLSLLKVLEADWKFLSVYNL